MRNYFLLLCFLFCFSNVGTSQLQKVTFEKEDFVAPTVENLTWLMSNIDTTSWNNALFPLGFKSLPFEQMVNSLEYKKVAGKMSQYIGLDAQYGVVSMMWKDESGKHYVSKKLRKSLKGKEHEARGFYRVRANDKVWVIGIESNKSKAITEMITIEVEKN